MDPTNQGDACDAAAGTATAIFGLRRENVKYEEIRGGSES